MKRQATAQTYILLTGTLLIGAHAFAGILSDYVYRPDPAYRYELVRTVQSDQGAGNKLIMVKYLSENNRR